MKNYKKNFDQSRRLHIIIGREVFSHYPEIAAKIMAEIKEPTENDLKKINTFLLQYCNFVSVLPENITGSIVSRTLSEIRKVFISSMEITYVKKPGLGITLSRVLNMQPQGISRVIKETRVRYKKDLAFKDQVNNFLIILKPASQAKKTT